MSCPGQCHGCAYKRGAAANKEGDNYFRGIFAALGGYPFLCHESLGWKGGRKGYPAGATNAVAILTMNRVTLVKLGADPVAIERQVADVRRGLRLCGGWKASVVRLKALGWFADRRVSLVRRHFAKNAAMAIERLTKDHPDRDGTEVKQIETAIEWFFNEAKEAGIKIGWLFGMEGKRRVEPKVICCVADRCSAGAEVRVRGAELAADCDQSR